MSFFNLSPNEEAAILQQERDRRRKLRIQQVREQERQFARKVRKDVRQRKAVELRVLAEQLHDKWQKEQQEKTEALRKVYEKNLKSIGEGHRAAANQEPQEEKHAALALRNKRAAQRRHNVALDKLRDEHDEQKQKEYAHILSRLTALEIEKARAAKIASLPPPIKETGEDVKPSQPVKCVEDFSTTHYHVTAEFVERAEPHEQGDARKAAQEEEERLKEEQQNAERESKEYKEKAILRHKHAHKRALLEQDMDRLMDELGQMEQADRRRRQAIVAKIPHQVFQAPHRRLEEREEQQLNLEQAFEDMYMANTEFTGDLTLALEPRVPEGDHDLDLTTESTAADEPGVTLLQPPSFPRGTDDVVSQEEMSGTVGRDGTRPLTRSETLKKLMSRIQNQRHEWRDKPAQDSSSAGELPSDTQLKQVTKPPTAGAKSSSSSEADNRSESATTLTSSSSGDGSKAGKDKSSDLSEHPINNDGNGTTPSESLEGGSLTDEARAEPTVSGSSALMHPMEHAARLRSTKLPDMHQLKKDQQQLMQKEQEQRQQLAQQQLHSHKEQHKHLQTLQRNLEERQQALDRQIKQQSVGQRYSAQDEVQRVPSKSSSQLIMHHPEDEPRVQDIQHQGRVSSAGLQRDISQRQHVVGEYQQPPTSLQSTVAAEGAPKQLNQQPLHERLDESLVVPSQDKPTRFSVPSEQVPETFQDAPILHPNRSPDNALPGQVQHTTGAISAQQQRIHDYQLQLVAQSRQSQNTLLEAQARLQQRRMNLLKQYPELKLPDYSPYVSKPLDQEPNVIYSQAEKELGPVSVLPGQVKPAALSQADYQRHSGVISADHPVETMSRELGSRTLHATLPQNQLVGSDLSTVPDTHLLNSKANSLTAQQSVPPDIPIRMTPQQLHQSSHLPDQPDLSVRYQEQSESRQTKPVVAISEFRDFLKQQREKVEQQNREHQKRIREKQEELKEQIKRQMDQYRDQFIAQQEERSVTGGQEAVKLSNFHPSHMLSETADTGNQPNFSELPSRLQDLQVKSTQGVTPSQPELMIPLDDSAMKQSIDQPHEAFTRAHHPPPPTCWAFTAQSEGVRPHELSTIIEVDTPRSEKKSLLYSPEVATSSSHNQALGLGYQQEHRSHLESESVKEQSLLQEVQRDMAKVLEDVVTHPARPSPYPSAKHHSLPLKSQEFPLRPVAGSKSPSSALRHYQEPEQGDFGNASVSTLSEHMNSYELPNLTLQSTGLHDKSAHDHQSDRSKLHTDHNVKPSLSPTKYDPSAETSQLVTRPQERKDTVDVSEVPLLSRLTDIPLSQSGITPKAKTILVVGGDDALEPKSNEASIAVTSGFHRSLASQLTMRGSDGFPLYAHDVGRGVVSYPESKVLFQTSSLTTTLDHLTPGSTMHPSSTAQKTDNTQTGPHTRSVTSEPVIEIFQPTVDESPPTAHSSLSTPRESLDGQHFAPLSRRSFGSGSSSSSDDTPGKDNGAAVWRTPKSAKGSSLRTDPFQVEGMMQSLSRHSFESMSEECSPSIKTQDGSKRETSEGVKWRDLLTQEPDLEDMSMFDQSRVSVLSQHPLGNSLDQTGLESFRVQDNSVDQFSYGFPKTTLKQSVSSQSYQPGSIHISGVPDLSYLHSQNREVIGAELSEQVEINVTEHEQSNLLQQTHSQDRLINQHSVSLSASLPQPAIHSAKPTSDSLSDFPPPQPHGHLVGNLSQPELSGHSLDPTYSGFLPSHTSSQITESGEIPDNIPHIGAKTSHSYREMSRESPPAEKPHIPQSDFLPDRRSETQISQEFGRQADARNMSAKAAYRYSDAGDNAELSQHSIDIKPIYHSALNVAAGSNAVNQPQTLLDPSKDSLSSIEELRTQRNQEIPLMPLFSDVSISQKSASFESDQGDEISTQSQRSSETRDPTFAPSERYSLPWPHWDEGARSMQQRDSTERPQLTFQSFQSERSRFMGQTSSSAEDQFQPLHEVTSSTLPGDEHTGSVETGILEEPDLTLVSLNTTQCSAHPDIEQEQWEPQVATCQTDLIEAEMSEDQSGLEEKENVEPTDTSEGSTLSLQEAFARRKAGFIQSSMTRQQDVKIRAKSQSATAFSTTVTNKKTPKESKTKKLTPKSADSSKPSNTTPKFAHQTREGKDKDTGLSRPPSKGKKPQNKTTTRDDRKAAQKEMYQRTGRSYNQLDEVKEKKVERERKEQYATNRQKRKEFEQKLQNRLNKWAKNKDN